MAQVFLDEVDWSGMTVMDNDELVLYNILNIDEVPSYMQERIAMLRMCEIDEQQRGELNGRNLGPGSVLVYLTYDEFNELKSIGVQEKP